MPTNTGSNDPCTHSTSANWTPAWGGVSNRETTIAASDLSGCTMSGQFLISEHVCRRAQGHRRRLAARTSPATAASVFQETNLTTATTNEASRRPSRTALF
jgi:hypothetical protein